MAADPLTSRTVDDLMLEDAGFDSDDDPFNERPPPLNTTRDDKALLSPRKRKATNENPFAASLDEEIKITKQRKKIPKLDAERLLSEPGIPKIRTLQRSGQLKQKLRLKGKGHEFTDAAKLLNYYQLWLDNLYPRAKFADAIQLVEKAGHTKKMQMYRKSWIDEGKPGYIKRSDVDEAIEEQERLGAHSDVDISHMEYPHTGAQPLDEDPASMFFDGPDLADSPPGDGPDDDELDALLAHGGESASVPATNAQPGSDSEGEDDLDALLAQESMNSASLSRSKPVRQSSLSQDEDLKIVGEQITGNGTRDGTDDLPHDIPIVSTARSNTGNSISNDVDVDDWDDLDALLNSDRTHAEPDLPMSNLRSAVAISSADKDLQHHENIPDQDNIVSSSPIPNIQVDDLDQLLDEHDAANEKGRDADIIEEFLASSPLPNRESQ